MSAKGMIPAEPKTRPRVSKRLLQHIAQTGTARAMAQQLPAVVSWADQRPIRTGVIARSSGTVDFERSNRAAKRTSMTTGRPRNAKQIPRV